MSHLPQSHSDGCVATWVAGPTAGRRHVLGPGDHLVGRAPACAVRTPDPTVTPFHLCLEVGHDSIVATQLAGRRPVEVGGVPIDGPTVLDATRPAEDEGDEHDGRTADAWPGHLVRVGQGVLLVEPIAGASAAEGGVPTSVSDDAATVAGPPEARVALVRRARAVSRWEPVPIPDEPTAGAVEAGPLDLGGLVPAVLALVGTVAVGLVLRQPMYMLFGFIGALVAAGGWLVQVRADRRSRRAAGERAVDADGRRANAIRVQRDGFVRHLRRTAGSLHSAVAAVHALRTPPGAGSREVGDAGAVWERRPDHGDAWRVVLGIGDVAWEPTLDRPGGAASPWAGTLDAAWLPELPVLTDLAPGCHLAVSGPHALAVVRSLVVQMAVQAGPADWELLIVSDRPDRWAWADGLPHGRSDGSSTLLDEDDLNALLRDGGPATDRHTIVVVDRPDLLAARTGPLRRFLAHDRCPSSITVLSDGGADDGADGRSGAVPALVGSVLVTLTDASGRWTPDTSAPLQSSSLTIVGAAAEDAAAVAARLRHYRDPEDPRTLEDDLPRSVRLVDLPGVPVDASSIGVAWSSGGIDPSPSVPIGLAADGLVELDLDRDGPHALVAGTTGSGKSEFLRSFVVGLAARRPPDQMTFVLVDYKGGAAFDVLGRLPHVVGSVTDLDDALAERALRSLRAELTRRERILRELGASDLHDARRRADAPVLPRLVVVVDEFAALAVELPDFLHALVGIAQRGRSLGVHLVLATQRPNGVIGDDIRANTNLRLALRLQDVADAVDVVGDPAPALLPRSLPGRAVVRLGADEHVTFQAARCADDDLDQLIDGIVATWADAGGVAPAGPWVAPLPTTLEPTDLGTLLGAAAESVGVIGVVDRPDDQRHEPLAWTPAEGHLVVAGAPGSGVSTTLRALVGAHLCADPFADVTVLAADVSGWESIGSHPRCRGVIDVADGERRRRVLCGSGEPGALVVVDGVGALRDVLDEPHLEDEWQALVHRLVDGASTVLLGVDAIASILSPVVARVPNRWVMHLHDAHDAAVWGVPVGLVPGDVPGRLVDVGTLGIAQVVSPSAVAGELGRDLPIERLDPVGTLPSVVPGPSVSPGRADVHGVALPVGLAFDDLGAATIEVPDGEHVLVVGPARSGRSTALVRLATAWCEARPSGSVVAIAPRRSPWWESAVRHLDDVVDLLEARLSGPEDDPTLLVVDDADLVDDPVGRLAALVSRRDPRLLVVAAARGEALRQSYGHWTGMVRRGRLGIVLTGATDLDGDLLGAALPRRLPIAARAGLAHLVADGDVRLVQIGSDDPLPPTLTDPARVLAHLASARAPQRVPAVV